MTKGFAARGYSLIHTQLAVDMCGTFLLPVGRSLLCADHIIPRAAAFGTCRIKGAHSHTHSLEDFLHIPSGAASSHMSGDGQGYPVIASQDRSRARLPFDRLESVSLDLFLMLPCITKLTNVFRYTKAAYTRVRMWTCVHACVHMCARMHTYACTAASF